MPKLTVNVTVTWEITHSESVEGTIIQVWQYVNGCSDGGFSCLVKDYSNTVAIMVGVGQLGLKLSNKIYEYVKKFNLK